MVLPTIRRWLAIAIISLLLVTIFLPLALLPKTAHAENLSNSVHSAHMAPNLGTYGSPSWWNGDCDKGNYPQAYVLTTWRGIQVCGPLPGLNSTGRLEDFHDYGAGADQYEFQCTELIARYLWAAYGLQSQVANGSQIVDTYTGLQNSPFHKVVNDGNLHMAPLEGDVLSYGSSTQSSSGHTSVVTGSSVDDNGNGTINVIEQNIEQAGVSTLTLANWVIQPDGNHFGSVSSWMTTMPLSMFTTGIWAGQGTYNNGNSPFQVIFKVTTIQGNSFSGTWEVPDYGDSIVAVEGTVTYGTDSASITFTDNASIQGNGIQLNCTYNATVSMNGQISGVWYYPNDTSPDGTLELNPTA
jgi:hypothetical protein